MIYRAFNGFKKCGCAHIILTLGGDGCLLLDKGQISFFPAQTVQKWGTFPAFASLEEMNALYPEMFSLLKA